MSAFLGPILRAAVASMAVLLLPAVGGAESYSEAYANYRAAIQERDLQMALIYAAKAHQAASSEEGLGDAQRAVLAYNLGAVSYQVKRYRDALPPLQELSLIHI